MIFPQLDEPRSLPLSGLIIQTVFSPRGECTCPCHGQPSSPGGYCGKQHQSFTGVQINNIHSLSPIHKAGHLAIEDQVDQAGPASPKPMLAGPDPPVVLYMPHDGTQDDLLHFVLHWHQGHSDTRELRVLAIQ